MHECPVNGDRAAMLQLKAVLFDFDFTLGDSSGAIVACIGYAMEQLGLEAPPEEAIRSTIGLSLPETFYRLAHIKEPGSCPAGQAEAFERHFLHRADEIMVAGARLFDSTPQVVRSLREHDLQLGIVTTKFRRRIEAILCREGLSECFGVIVGGDDVGKPKPDPEGLLLALAKLGAGNEQSLYVGDSETDARAAQAAGVPFVAVCTGMLGARAFAPYSPLAVLDELSALPPLITRLATQNT